MKATVPARHKYRFPWREGNRFRLLVDGSSYFPVMLETIGNARHYVLLEMYLFESGQVADRFINALATAARRGVAVHVLLDDYGAKGLIHADRTRLLEAGVRLTFYNPVHYGELRRSLFRDHRKLLVVDGQVAFTGGAGITDEFDPLRHPLRYWHDSMVEIRGAVVQDWRILYEQNWNRWTPAPIRLPDLPREMAGDQLGRVTVSRNAIRSEIVRSFVSRIRYADRRVWLATAYFVPSWKLRRALRHSARQGTDVRLMLPGPHTDHPFARHMGRRYYTSLLVSGVRIFEYQPRFLHAKILLCDHWTSMGSSNVDRWNFRWNLEANQEIDDAEFARAVQARFELDLADCREIVSERWARRPWDRRVQEWFWGKVESLLAWFSDRKNTRRPRDEDP